MPNGIVPTSTYRNPEAPSHITTWRQGTNRFTCFGGRPYFVDVFSDRFEFDDPAGYINRAKGALPAGHPFGHVTLEMVLQAKAEVRRQIETKANTGWQVFNGKKFGVARVRRSRTAESEHHRLAVNIYLTDYHTNLFAKRLYGLLCPDRSVRIDQSDSFHEYSGLLTSFGVDIVLFAPRLGLPHLILTKRSKNVANSDQSFGLWHVSMNEGLSASDRFAQEFDVGSTVYRGFLEELNLSRRQITRAELFEPFIEYNNFEIGIAGAAYTSVDADRIIQQAATASDRLLETADISAISATKEGMTAFLHSERDRMTNLLDFCLRSALSRNIGAT